MSRNKLLQPDPHMRFGPGPLIRIIARAPFRHL